MSGVSVEAELQKEFKLLKFNKHPHPVKLLVMQLSSDKTQIVKIPDLCLQECSAADLQDFFSHKERKTTCYYALFDWNEKLYLIKWVPDTANIKDKFLFAGSFGALKKAFGGVKGIIQASELDELMEKELAAAKC